MNGDEMEEDSEGEEKEGAPSEVNESTEPLATAPMPPAVVAPAPEPLFLSAHPIGQGTAANFLFRDMGSALARIRIPQAVEQPYDEDTSDERELEEDKGKGRGMMF